MTDFSLKSVLVIGAGTMGAGIAQWMAQQGCATELVDINFELCQSSLLKIHTSWDKLALKGKFESKEIEVFKENLSIKSLDDIDTSPDLVIEAIIESLEIKRKLFHDLDSKLSIESIFATNTSSIPIEQIAELLPVDRQRKFLGLHFFNPATIMKLVEVIQSKWTNPAMAVQLETWFNQQGKKAVLCADRPGFIVNRVARNFYGEALRIAETDDEAKIKEIDKVLTDVGGFRMGPFSLMDLIGIDINLAVTHSVWEAFDREPRFAPHQLQEELVKQGRFGKKTNKGFYSYES